MLYRVPYIAGFSLSALWTYHATPDPPNFCRKISSHPYGGSLVWGCFLIAFTILSLSLLVPFYFFIIFFLSFFGSFSRAALAAYGGSQTRGLIRAVVAAGLSQSHSNTGSEPHLRSTPYSQQHWILNPLGKARDWTCNLMFLVGFINHWAMTGTAHFNYGMSWYGFVWVHIVGILCASCTWISVSFFTFGKFSAVIWLNTFLTLLSVFPFWDPYKGNVDRLDVVFEIH